MRLIGTYITQYRIVAILLVSLIVALIFPSRPLFAQSTLNQFHPGCDDLEYPPNDPRPRGHPVFPDSRNPDCVAAVHRFCSVGNRGGAGVTQEVGNSGGTFGVACFRPSWYGDVPLSDLTHLHPGCDSLTKSQTPECMSAVHRWCGGRGGAGLVQELGAGVFGVACFQTTSYQDVSTNDLRSLHSGCDSTSKSQKADCVAAIHRWCVNNRNSSPGRNASAGLSQETGNGVLGVACFNSTLYTDVDLFEPTGGVPPR